MAGIINGRVVASSTGHEPIRFTELPTPIKYLLLEVPAENMGDVYVGNSTVSNNNAPLLAKGTPRELTFRHDVKEAPADLPDFYVTFGHNPFLYTHLRAHDTKANPVFRLLLQKKN